ncbi:MAG: ABC transporter permease [Oscillospiraceae bacterium]|nr:ABC transporter permease [Oscillospiraceae bacterium]
MGKLFIYEIKKNILKLSLLFLLIGLLAVNFYKIRETVRYEGAGGFFLILYGEESPSDTMKKFFYGEITAEKIQEIQAYSDKMAAIIAEGNYDTKNPSNEFYTGYAYGDNNVIGEIKRAVRDAYLYPNSMAELKGRADKCIDFFSGRNQYEVRKNELLKTLYNGRKISVYGNFEAVDLYLDYEFSAFVIMISMIFAFSAIFSVEAFTGTDKIINSGGRAKSSFRAKQFTMYAFAAALTLVFSLIDILSFGSYYGLSFLDQPLYTLSDYHFSPYSLTIIGAIMLSLLFKTIALIFAGEVILTVSSLTKNLGAAMTLCFAAIGVLIFINGYIPEWLSPFTLFSTEKMIGEFKCLNIFGCPVLEPIVTLLSTVVYIVSLHIICYIRTAKRARLITEVRAK